MRAAVTGAAGFVGRSLVGVLLDRGDSVRALFRPPREEPPEWRGRAETVRADLGSGIPEKAWRDIDVVFHCAAQVRPTWDRRAYVRNNVLATRIVLEGSQAAGVRRVVHFSSIAVHGEDVDHRGADEGAPFSDPPSNPYVATKIEAERVVEEFRRRDLDVVVLRPGWVWGPHDPGILGIARQLRWGRFLLPGPGTSALHLVYVENLVHAAIQAALLERARKETFLIHDDFGLTAESFLRELAAAIGVQPRIRRIPVPLAFAGASLFEAVSRGLRRDPAVTRYQAAILARNQGFSVEKARRVLGYCPPIPFGEAMARTASWLNETLAR